MTSDARAWYFLVAGQRFGPVDATGLHSAYRAGQLSGTDLVWAEGMPEWRPAAEFIDQSVVQSAEKLDKWAVWSLVLGLLSIFGLFIFIMLPSAIAGLILGIRARHSSKRGFAIAGTALSSVGLLIWVLLLFLLLIAVATMGWDQFMVEVMAGLESLQ